MALTNFCDNVILDYPKPEEVVEMSVVENRWSSFRSGDGTIVNCLLNGDLLELVVLETPDGPSVDVDPEYVDLEVIRAGLNNKDIKIH